MSEDWTWLFNELYDLQSKISKTVLRIEEQLSTSVNGEDDDLVREGVYAVRDWLESVRLEIQTYLSYGDEA